MAIYFFFGFLLLGLSVLLCLLVNELVKWHKARWMCSRTHAGRSRSSQSLPRNSGQISFPVAEHSPKNAEELASFNTADDDHLSQTPPKDSPRLYEKAFPVPEMTGRQPQPPGQLPDEKRTGLPEQQGPLDETLAKPASIADRSVSRARTAKPVSRVARVTVASQKGANMRAADNQKVGKAVLSDKKTVARISLPSKTVRPTTATRVPVSAARPGGQPKRPATAATPKATVSIPWRQEFFEQLAKRACAGKCFIYNPDKKIGAGTNRLEIGEPALTHTGWGVNESRVWLELYSADPAKADNDVPENNRRFKTLKTHKAAIEKAFGEPLDWDYAVDRKHQKVVTHTDIKASKINSKSWPKIQTDLINRATRLHATLKPYLAVLDDSLVAKGLVARQAETKAAAPVRPKPVVAPPAKPARKTVQKPRLTLAKQPEFDPDDLTI